MVTLLVHIFYVTYHQSGILNVEHLAATPGYILLHVEGQLSGLWWSGTSLCLQNYDVKLFTRWLLHFSCSVGSAVCSQPFVPALLFTVCLLVVVYTTVESYKMGTSANGDVFCKHQSTLIQEKIEMLRKNWRKVLQHLICVTYVV